MNPDLSEKVSSKIEALCGLGCSRVNQLLKQANNGYEIEELAEFNHVEVRQIIQELDNIMAVYDSDDEDSIIK